MIRKSLISAVVVLALAVPAVASAHHSPPPQPPSDCPNKPPQPPPPTPPAPPAPCNCPAGPPGPAGPAGPPGTTTVITVVENHNTVTYVDKTCTSQRVFHLTIARRMDNDDRLGGNARQRIVGARITWRGADAAHNRVVKTANASTVRGRLRVDADFRNVVATPGQVRVIDVRVTLANGHRLNLTRKVRLCLGRDGNLNYPTDIPQTGRPDGAQADEARAASGAKA